MSLLDHVKRFKLIILNEEFYVKHIRDRSPFDGLYEQQGWRQPDIPFDLDYLIKEKILYGDWESFKDWYIHNNEHQVYRGVGGYNRAGLRNLLKYGNDRHASEPRHGSWDIKILEEFGLRPQEFIWAAEGLRGAWGSAKDEGSKNLLITAYDRRLLKEERRNSVYSLEDGVNSFRESLSAVIQIYLRF